MPPPLPRGVLRDAVLLPDDPAHRAGEGLLRRGDLSVTDVCFAVGCTSLGSFSARFTELVGETPSTYRARNHDELRVVPACQTMVLTRPRRGAGQGRAEESSFGEASVAAPA